MAANEPEPNALPPGATILIPLIIGSAVLAVVLVASSRFLTEQEKDKQQQVLAEVMAVFRSCVEHLDAGKFAEAEATAGKAIRLAREIEETSGQPNFELLGNAYFFRGRARAMQRPRDKLLAAEKDFTVCLEKNGEEVFAYFLRAQVRYKLGRVKEAEGDFTAALRLRPNYAAAYNDRAVARADLGDQEGATADRARASQLGFLPE